ncbi:MAG: hypothetical protein V2I97_13065 [Desulfococcaceae bacterium]|nr:hypothetical protein [Desulfococcaceae bacterium]
MADNKTDGNQESILGEIIIYAVLIIILLIFLLRIIDRVGEQKEISSLPAKNISDSVEEELKKMLASFTQTLKEQGIQNTDRVMAELQHIAGYVKSSSPHPVSENQMEQMKKELARFRKNMESYPKRISEKLDHIIVLIENQKPAEVIYASESKTDASELKTDASESKTDASESKTDASESKTDAPESKPENKKPRADTGKKSLLPPKVSPDYTYEGQNDIRKAPNAEKRKKTAAPVLPVAEKEKPVFRIADSILDRNIIRQVIDKEEEGISGKKLCINKNTTVHFLSNQMLVRLVRVYPPDRWNPGSAMIDLTHPRLGMRRFSEMEEGTTRPFEYNSKTYFLELMKIHKNCADIAVYERKSS